MAGTNLIYGLGMIESGVTFDFGQLVMDDEFARMVKQVVGGIAVNDATLMVDEIAAVGSFGDFLSLDSTLRHMREQSQPALIDRRVRDDWQERGASDLATRSLERARTILDSHHPEPLPEEVRARVRAIVAGADEDAGVG
ncbi:MAG: Trimethylamine methyltransferase (MTTB) [Actinobacteria bacterium ADurb.BinA094]|nr:MAG: Trimethylamine methyltransferase (MTTB) [Actinobacteria bacterium ADurb.BinA094]